MADGDANSLDRIFTLISRLRGKDGCPWDRKQRLDDVLSDLVEEAYELEWAGAHHGDAEILDEMGDVLFVLCFALAIKRESAPEFSVERIASHAHDKIRSRHPHVFGDAHADTPEESIAHWERMKAAERARRNQGALDGVAGNLPPLRHAVKIQERAASVGFDWDDVSGVIAKLHEEIDELESALRAGERNAVEHEMGDLLFSAANVSRFIKIDADEALQKSTSRFMRRFRSMEDAIRSEGKRFEAMTLAELDVYWERAKSE